MAQKMPDIVAGVIGVLEDDVSLAAVTDVSTDLTGYVQGDLWITVGLITGQTVVRGRLWTVQVDVNVYGPTEEDASDMARVAMLVIENATNTVTSDGVLTRCEITVPAFADTDPVNASSRYVFTAAITARPL